VRSYAFSGWHERGGSPASGRLFGVGGSWNTIAKWNSGARHLQKSNFLAADGHAVLLTGASVSAGQTASKSSYTGGNYTQARGAEACDASIIMTMSPR
jgi:prepilin-type processing-associated H-X9-DG protein